MRYVVCSPLQPIDQRWILLLASRIFQISPRAPLSLFLFSVFLTISTFPKMASLCLSNQQFFSYPSYIRVN